MLAGESASDMKAERAREVLIGSGFWFCSEENIFLHRGTTHDCRLACFCFCSNKEIISHYFDQRGGEEEGAGQSSDVHIIVPYEPRRGSIFSFLG